MDGMALDRRWPELSSYQRRLRSSVTKPSWTIRTPDRSGGFLDTLFLEFIDENGGGAGVRLRKTGPGRS